MSEVSNILEQSVARLFEEQVTNEFLSAVEQNGFPQPLWEMVTELGVPQILLNEEAGGMGGTWTDAYLVVRLCGYAGVPLPIPECIIAGWLAQQSGLDLGTGVTGLIAEVIDTGALSDAGFNAEIKRIPWGRDATQFLGITQDNELVVIGREGLEIECEDNLGHDPRDNVVFRNSPVLHKIDSPLPNDSVRCLCAMLRSAQIAGAGARCLEIGVGFTSEREQFGRTLSRFQAIQHNLAVMAGELGTVEAMSAAAFNTMDNRGLRADAGDARFDIAAAKCRASDAVEPLTRIGHQVHGAIGFTYEYGLHFLTRRLWSWRAEFGGSGEWAEYLGQVAIERGGDEIWAAIAT